MADESGDAATREKREEALYIAARCVDDILTELFEALRIDSQTGTPKHHTDDDEAVAGADSEQPQPILYVPSIPLAAAADEPKDQVVAEEAEAIRQSWLPFLPALHSEFTLRGYSDRVASAVAEPIIEHMAIAGLTLDKVRAGQSRSRWLNRLRRRLLKVRTGVRVPPGA
jgi:hypothetical protein